MDSFLMISVIIGLRENVYWEGKEEEGELREEARRKVSPLKVWNSRESNFLIFPFTLQ